MTGDVCSIKATFHFGILWNRSKQEANGLSLNGTENTWRPLGLFSKEKRPVVMHPLP